MPAAAAFSLQTVFNKASIHDAQAEFIKLNITKYECKSKKDFPCRFDEQFRSIQKCLND